MAQAILFYTFAALVIGAGTMVITVRNPVYAVLSLVIAFFASAGLWMMLEAEFLAIALVLVYVGAVMVLFLFVVMMLDINIAVVREGFARYVPVAVVFAALMMASISLVVGPRHFSLAQVAAPPPLEAGYNNTQALGRAMFSQNILPFEAAAVILLVAIVAAIALTLRTTRQTKAPKAERQVKVQRNDRLRIIKMEAEKDA